MTVYSVTTGNVVQAQDVTQFTQLLTGSMTDQPVTISNRVRAQLLGSQAGSGGYVGHSYSGPPTSASFVAGDYVVDQNGTVWICIAGGSPGTWRASGTSRIGQPIVLNASSSIVSFTSIPATYSHLMVVCEARGDASATYTDVYVQCNSDAGSNYSRVSVNANVGDSSPSMGYASSQTAMIGFIMPCALVGSSVNGGGGVAWLRNYASTTWAQKSLTSLANAGIPTSMVTRTWHSIWSPASPAAVTRLDLYPGSGNFVAGSRFDLYGMP